MGFFNKSNDVAHINIIKIAMTIYNLKLSWILQITYHITTCSLQLC